MNSSKTVRRSDGTIEHLEDGPVVDVRFKPTVKTTKEGVEYQDGSSEEQARKGFTKTKV